MFWKATDLCESFELSIVQIGLETTELRGDNEIQLDTVGGGRCVSEALALRLAPFVDSLLHRDDLVPRLSDANAETRFWPTSPQSLDLEAGLVFL